MRDLDGERDCCHPKRKQVAVDDPTRSTHNERKPRWLMLNYLHGRLESNDALFGDRGPSGG